MSKGTYAKLLELKREGDDNSLKGSVFFKKRIEIEEDKLTEILQELREIKSILKNKN